VLTAIVISFAMTALFLVVLLASRGLTGTDHVDGREPRNDGDDSPDRRADPAAAADRRLMLMLGEKHRPLKAKINLFSSLSAWSFRMLLQWTQTTGVPGSIGVYLPGNWQAPFGIVLVVDRLSALMLVLTGIIGVSALLFAMARWDGAGSSFHALFQIQLMGLYGAFLTADLFNLFVFFEVLLAASYGLMLHGSGRRGYRRACITSRSTCWPRRCS
jgi:formate hydrogenlyase subunit 3/multisubunit Na+/H+ antiporter MnhD subunit